MRARVLAVLTAVAVLVGLTTILAAPAHAAYVAPSTATGGCSGEFVQVWTVHDTDNGQQKVVGELRLWANDGTRNDGRLGKPGYGISARNGTWKPSATSNWNVWVNASTNATQSSWNSKYQGSYPDASTSSSVGPTPCLWIDANTGPGSSTLINPAAAAQCLNFGASLTGPYTNQRLHIGMKPNGIHEGERYAATCTVRDYPWTTDTSYHPPTTAYATCMGRPQLGIPMRDHNENYVAKLTLFYNPKLYPLGYTGPPKPGEFCAAIVPAPGYENTPSEGIQVRMTLDATNGTHPTAERASSNTSVSVNSPAGIYNIAPPNCVTVEGWSRMFSATENAIYETAEWCGPYDKVPQVRTADQIEELYGTLNNCLQIFGRYMFFDSVWQGSCDPGTFPTALESSTWSQSHPVVLRLYCLPPQFQANESRTVNADMVGALFWNFNGYRCAGPIFGIPPLHELTFDIQPPGYHPQFNPNYLRFGT